MLDRIDKNLLLFTPKFLAQKEYWTNKLSGDIEKTGILLGHHKNVGSKGKREEIPIAFPENLVNRLMKLSKKSDLSLYLLLLTGLKILISRHSTREDIVVISPLYKFNTSNETINNCVFIRDRVSDNLTFKELLLEVRETTLKAYENQDYPYDKLMEYVPKQISQNQDSGLVSSISCSLTGIHNHKTIEALPIKLAFSFAREKDQLEGNIIFDSCAYEKIYMRHLSKHLIRILKQAVEDINIKIPGISFLSDQEKKQLVFDFNNTQSIYPKEKTIVELFEEQVEKTPNHLALVYQSKQLTFVEMNKQSNYVEQILREKDVKSGSIVGIMVEPCLEMVVGIVGILKAGGAFLPLEPESPEERINFVLRDSSAEILLTQAHLMETFKTKNKAVNVVNVENSHTYSHEGEFKNLKNVTGPSARVYVIYTSGTSGRPKGVLITNKNLVNYIYWFARSIHLTANDRAILTSSFAFDALYTQLFASLLMGCELHVIPRENFLFAERLLNYIRKNKIAYIKVTPSLFNLIVSSPNFSKKMLRGLRFAMIGGEELNVKDVEKAHGLCPHLQMMNHYGPTETTIGSIARFIDFNQFQAYKVTPTIGKPIANTQVYILDNKLNMVPIGVVGELFIGGDGVGLGYLNKPELTFERFIEIEVKVKVEKEEDKNKKGTGKQIKKIYSHMSYIYKTGDLARWCLDGNIEFLGRADQQVKIRGYRVEPGEIESHLLKHDEIKEAVVIVKEKPGGEKYLCAYLVAERELKVSRFQELLSHQLPPYMIPSYFIQLEKMPLTKHNKLNRWALPEPSPGLSRCYQAPKDRVEQKLVEAWADVLGLGKESIGTDINFFQLGGHSLNAVILLSRLHRTFNVVVPLAQLFKTPTIKGLAACIKDSESSQYVSIEAAEQKEYYAPSSAQKRLYILQQMDIGTTTYNIPRIVLLEGKPVKERLKNIFIQLIQRHDSLRTSFRMTEEKLIQEIHRDVLLHIECYQSPGDEIEKIVKDFVKPFNLKLAPLIRVGLIRIGEDRCILMVDMHHIASDGLSMNILVKEFTALYHEESLPPLKLQYKDFSQWQNRDKEKEEIRKQEEYWQQQFEGEIPILNLPTDYVRPAIQNFEGNHLLFLIGKEQTQELRALGKRKDATTYMVLLAIFNAFLSKISNQEDIVVGTSISGRRHADLEHTVGMFVSTLALRNYPQREKTYQEFLSEVKKRLLEAFENQDYQFEDLVENAAVNRDVGRNPLFDIMFAFQSIDTEPNENELPEIQIPALDQNPFKFEHRTSKFDLTLGVLDTSADLHFAFEYCTKLFKESTIRRFVSYFKKVISDILNNPAVKIAGIDIVPKEERHHLLYTFNNTGLHYPKHRRIDELLEDQVEKTPDQIAVIGQCAGRRPQSKDKKRCALSYRELNEKSLQLAYRLREKGVKTNSIVGIMAERSGTMMVGILAILKAGGAYLPIDPDYPGERIKYILEDSVVKLILSQKSPGERFENLCQFIGAAENNTDHPNPGKLEKIKSPHDPVYVMYTSGSTGKPKGVIITNRSFINFITGITNIISFGSQDHILSLTTLSFDISGLETLLPLTRGSRVTIGTREEQLSAGAAASVIAREKITIFQTTPSQLQVLLWDERAVESLRILKYLLVGGDLFSPSLLQRVRDLVTGKIYNLYGPTETTIWSTVKEVTGEAALNIGKPICNTMIYILSFTGAVQPLGVPGELFISGAGVARGYLNRPALTREKFIKNPFVQGEILYTTGDLARWLPDGNIEFLGRIDRQVKIRGVRIEPGEIESRLLEIEYITDAVVMDKKEETGEKNLCAYVVSNREIKGTEIKHILSTQMPGYMIPSHIVRLEKIPITPNGKIDRNALPAPGIEACDEKTAPQNETEKKLVKIWSKVLNVDQEVIGINTNFFELGGHSLKAAVLLSKIHQDLEVSIPLAELFRTPTIKGLAKFTTKVEKSKYISMEPAEQKEYYSLSSVQKRLYLFQQRNPASTVYNMLLALEIEGELDKQELERAFKHLVIRHEALRTSFEMVGSEPVQKIHPWIEFESEYRDAAQGDRETGEQMVQAFIRPFDLTRAPLLRVGLIKSWENHFIIIIDMHHIISDGFSTEIIVKEMMQLYRDKPLPRPRFQYKDFSQWQNREDRVKDREKQETYWLKQFEDGGSVLNIPLDYERKPIRCFKGDIIRFELGEETVTALRELAVKENATLFMVLLAVYNIFLSKISGQEDIVVGTPVDGRGHPDLRQTIGMFVNMLPLRNQPTGNKTFGKFLSGLKENTLKAFKNQDYQYEDLVKKLVPHRKLNRNPLFDVAFTLANRDPQSRHIPEAEVSELELRPYEFKKWTSKFDFTFTGFEADNQLVFFIEYSSELFKLETIENFKNHFREVLEYVVKNSDIKLKDISISHDLLSTRSNIKQVKFGF